MDKFIDHGFELDEYDGVADVEEEPNDEHTAACGPVSCEMCAACLIMLHASSWCVLHASSCETCYQLCSVP